MSRLGLLLVPLAAVELLATPALALPPANSGWYEGIYLGGGAGAANGADLDERQVRAPFDAFGLSIQQVEEPDDWEVAWQSRSGSRDEPWLEPDINDVLARRGASGSRQAVVQAIGFLFDHVEVLYDLDVRAAATARQAGVTMLRAPCAHDHPAFIAMLADRVLGAGPHNP